MRWRRPTHDDIPGFIAAAILATSTSSGKATLRRRSMTVRSAMLPWIVS